MIAILKLLAHFVTCISLTYLLENKFGLTGAKFWIPYLLIGTAIYLVNSLPRD